MQTALQTYYSTAKEVELSHIQLHVVDAGLNILNLDYEIEVSAESLAVTGCNFPTNISFTPQSVIAGAAIFHDITFYRPCVGTYSLTFSTRGLDSVSTTLHYNSGYPTTLDVCTSLNSFTRIQTALCRDTDTYQAAEFISLRDFAVQMTDAGGYYVRSAWDSEPRNITVELESFMLASDQPPRNFTPTLMADWGGSLLADAGTVGWCNDSEDTNPKNIVTIDPVTGAYRYTTVYTNTAPSYCREIFYSGEAPDTHYNAGLKIKHGLAGTYRLKFASNCDSSRCPNAMYPVLESDILELTVIPGAPLALQVLTAPPFVNENNFALIPAPIVAAVDAVGNVCVQTNDVQIVVSVTPTPKSVSGTTTMMKNGIATFGSLKIDGTRGVEYQLTFTATSLDISVTPTTSTFIANCSIVRPNSEVRSGECACLPGFTADLSGETGYIDDVETRYVENDIELYKSNTPGTDPWLDALQPYGSCVPCKNGFYKSEYGDGLCTPCPAFMDTARLDGEIRQPYVAASGANLLGELGHVTKESCHCISQTSFPFESYYRQLPLDDYICVECPSGGKCYGNDINSIEALPGYSREDIDALTFRACPYAAACLGGVNSTCLGDGYTGKQCAACSDGYAYHAIRDFFPPKCYDCSKGAYAILNIPIVVVNFVWFVVLASCIRLVNQRRGSQAVSMVRSFLTYLQMTALAKHLNLDWPDPVKFFLLFSEKFSLPDIRSASAKCALSWNFYDHIIFHETLPVGLAIVLLLYFIILKYVEELREIMARAKMEATKKANEARANDSAEENVNGVDSHSVKQEKGETGLEEARIIGAYDRVISLAVTFLWLLYPTLVQYLIEFTQCTGSRGEDRYFVSDYSLKCSGFMYGVMTTFIVFCFIFYLVGIPLFLFQLARGEDILHTHKSSMVQYRLGLLIKGLDMKRGWWWEWLVFARKLTLILTVIIFRESAVFGGYAVNCLLQFFFLLHIVYRPHISDTHAKIETYGLLATLATFTSGLIYKQSSSDVSAVLNVVTALLFLLHLRTWYVFVITLIAQFRNEGEDAMINRAVRDLEFEKQIVDGFEAQRQEEFDHHEQLAKESERMRLKTKVGERLPFADDNLLETIKQDSTITIRAQHKELSSKLDSLRKKWRERTAQRARSERAIPLDERHLDPTRAVNTRRLSLDGSGNTLPPS